MAHALAQLIAERIAAGLRRKALTTCSRWSQACRVMGKPFAGPFSFKYHPWLREMHDCDSEMIVGQKSAQAGYTEFALNKSFFNIDVLSSSVLYVLPSQTPDATDFSAARFDPALDLSPHLSNLFSDVKNVGHKRAGNTNLYIRGSKSKAGLRSIPVALIVLDEVDVMEQENIPLALERVSGQMEKQVIAISTPTMQRHGINKMFLDSTMEHFFFKCPCCSRRTELVFPDCLVITADEVNDPRVSESHLICKECKGTLVHQEKTLWLADGKWVPSVTERPSRGFHVNQLYSSTVTPATLATSYLKALRDPAEEQEFYNSKLGLPHVVKGAGVSDENLHQSLGDYKMLQTAPRNACITIGIDVGRWLHYEIDQWFIPGNIPSIDLNVQAKCRVIAFGKVQDFDQLDLLMYQYNVMAGIIDANPERRKAYEFASRFYGKIKMCFYGQGIQGKQIHVGVDEEPTITVDRTSWLDLSLGRFRGTGMITIPLDVNEEYKQHIKALVRRYEKDKFGNPVGRYVKADNDEDHYAHARNYAEIALPFAASLSNARDITEEM
jgi:Phage terminase large subunit (GpA)